MQVFTPQISKISTLKRLVKGFLTTYVPVRIIKQKNFMLLVSETNHGLAYDRDVKVFFGRFYDRLFVAMVTKTL